MKIFLDMDGVLVNFIKGIHNALGIDYDLNHHPYEKGKWDMLTDIGGLNLSLKAVDALCTSDFWADLEWMPDGHNIFREVMSYRHQRDVYLLTTPMPNTDSASGKMRWIAEHLPHFLDRTIITRVPKAVLAGPGRILIDDKDQNIREWTEAGGIGVSVPRPWNSWHDCQCSTTSYMAHKLAEAFL